MSLFLPSEAKTLAPVDVKRDRRRPPSFCQKYQRNFGGGVGGTSRTQCQCKCKIADQPDLMLRGTEITETSPTSAACTSPLAASDRDSSNGIRGIVNDDKLFDTGDECMACSACIFEIERNKTPSPSIAACLNETELRLSYNKYHMDEYGNLNQNLEISCDGDGGDSLEMSVNQHSRPGSPDASHIIRITLNNKSNTSDDDGHRRTSNSSPDIDDKQNSSSCR